MSLPAVQSFRFLIAYTSGKLEVVRRSGRSRTAAIEEVRGEFDAAHGVRDVHCIGDSIDPINEVVYAPGEAPWE